MIHQNAGRDRGQDRTEATDPDRPTHTRRAYLRLIESRGDGIQPGHCPVDDPAEQQAGDQGQSEIRQGHRKQYNQHAGREQTRVREAAYLECRGGESEQNRTDNAAQAEEHPTRDALLGGQSAGREQPRCPAEHEVIAGHHEEERDPDERRRPRKPCRKQQAYGRSLGRPLPRYGRRKRTDRCPIQAS